MIKDSFKRFLNRDDVSYQLAESAFKLESTNGLPHEMFFEDALKYLWKEHVNKWEEVIK